jgi:hypothetical protein
MTTNFDSANQAFDFADQLALISSEVLRFRLRNKAKLSSEERKRLEDIETELDEATAKVRAAGIAELGKLSKAAQTEIKDATSKAEGVLKKMKKIEGALKLATAVLNLALAAIGGNIEATLAAAKSLGVASNDESKGVSKEGKTS